LFSYRFGLISGRNQEAEKGPDSPVQGFGKQRYGEEYADVPGVAELNRRTHFNNQTLRGSENNPEFAYLARDWFFM